MSGRTGSSGSLLRGAQGGKGEVLLWDQLSPVPPDLRHGPASWVHCSLGCCGGGHMAMPDRRLPRTLEFGGARNPTPTIQGELQELCYISTSMPGGCKTSETKVLACRVSGAEVLMPSERL